MQLAERRSAHQTSAIRSVARSYPQKALANLEERFWARVQKTDGCWLWTGAKAGRRYGQIRRGETMVYAHRVSWEIHYSPIPEIRRKRGELTFESTTAEKLAHRRKLSKERHERP